MTLIFEIGQAIFWVVVGLGIGAYVILDLVQGVVNPETWNMINHTDAIPDEFKRKIKQIIRKVKPTEDGSE